MVMVLGELTLVSRILYFRKITPDDRSYGVKYTRYTYFFT